MQNRLGWSSLVDRVREASAYDLAFYAAAALFAAAVGRELLQPTLILHFRSAEFGAVHVPAALGSAIGFGAGFAGGVFGAFIGVLTVTFLTLFGGLPITLAKGTTVAQAAFTSLFAAGNHYRAGTADLRVGAAVAAGGVVGAWSGAAWSATLGEAAMRTVFSTVLVLGGAYMAWSSRRAGECRSTDRCLPFAPEFMRVEGEFRGSGYRVDLISASAMGLVIGFVAGLLGVGGGFLLTPSISLLLGLPMHIAVGTSASVVVANTASATGGYLSQGAVFAKLALAVLVGGFFGARVGQRVNHWLPERALRVAFALLLLWSAWRMAP